MLAARALWLLGVCGGELPAAALGGAYQLCVCYLAAEDVVVGAVQPLVWGSEERGVAWMVRKAVQDARGWGVYARAQ